MRGGGRAGFTEKKYYDFVNVTKKPEDLSKTGEWEIDKPDYTSSGTETALLFAPDQGTAMYERIGRRAWISDIKIKFQVDFSQRSAASNNFDNCINNLTVVILIDKHVDQQSWSTNDAESVMAADAGGGVAVPEEVRHLAWTSTNTWGRYRVLKVMRFVRKPVNVEGMTAPVVSNRWADTQIKTYKHKFSKPLQVNYNGVGAGGDETNVNDIGLRMITFAENLDNTQILENFHRAELRYWGRVGFYDHK